MQVVDWGFAKLLAKGGTADEAASVQAASERSEIETVRSGSGSGSGSASLPGSMLGTPAYMPPEQARGDVTAVDRRSDVFALGAILCEILTGAPPYRDTDGDLVRQAANAELDGALGRLRRCGADEALVTLCTECLAPARRARPESAAKVADRIGAWLTSVEERARQAELLAAEARYRHRTTFVGAVASLVVVALATTTWTWLAQQARERREEATHFVSSAIRDASGARGKAQAAGLDAILWNAAVTSAELATSIARADDVDPRVRSEAAALLAEVTRERDAARAGAERLERDEQMLARLETLRVPTENNLREVGWQQRESHRLNTEYAAAFAQYLGGSSLFDDPVEASLASLRSGEIEAVLSATLDHWALIRGRVPAAALDPEQTQWLRELASGLDPNNAWRAALRELLLTAHDQGAALRALLAETNLTTLSANDCRVLAEALCRSSQAETTVDLLRHAQELFPRDFSLCVDLALHLEGLPEPRWEEALNFYRIARALRPNHTAVLFRQGVALERLGRVDDAERVHRMVLEKSEESPHALCHLGWTLAAQGRSAESLAAFQRAVELDPDYADAHKMIGAALIERGEVAQGIEHYRQALTAGPRAPVQLYNLGTVLMNDGQFVEATEHLREAVALDPRYTEAWGNLGHTLTGLDDLEKAMHAFEQALEVDAEHARTLFNLGNTYRRLGRPEDAVECFARALAVPPEDPRAAPHEAVLVNLGKVLDDLGQKKAAITCYEDALKLDPNNELAHHNLGYAFEDLGDTEEAASCYRRALAANPEFEPSRSRLARLEQRELLEEVLAGRRQADSPEQWSHAVLVGYQHGGFRQVVSLTESTLADSPELVGDTSWHAYNSACAAAILSADSDAGLDAEERERMRILAHTWLSGEVQRWRRWLTDGERFADARERLRHARQNSALASVRGEALESLPEPERTAWSALWNDLERALQ